MHNYVNNIVLEKEKHNARKYFFYHHKLINNTRPITNSLLGGKLGLVLYYYSLYEAFHNKKDANKSIVLLKEVLSDLNKPYKLFGNSFGTGLTGLAYIINILVREGLLEINFGSALKKLDCSLYESALQQINLHDSIDYLHGALGVLHYFTKRLPNPVVSKYTLNLSLALCSKAIEEKGGIWFRNYIMLEKEKEEINLSLAHGLSGILLLMISAQEKMPMQPVIINTIEKGIDFLWSHYKKVDGFEQSKSCFPSIINSINRKNKRYSARLAWCYGDLNIVMATYKAACLLKKPHWTREGTLLGAHTLTRMELTDIGATDSHFCHGTTGLAQFYKKLFEITGKPMYKNAWLYWIHKTLSLLPNENKRKLYAGKECNLLEGMVGVNLVLLSFISDNKLSWSESLLI